MNEKVIRLSMVDFIESKISHHQHRFVIGKSCLSNLLETIDWVINLIDEGFPVDILYFDFKTAFYRVPHNKLILKLKCLGIHGKVLYVINTFLSGRS